MHEKHGRRSAASATNAQFSRNVLRSVAQFSRKKLAIGNGASLNGMNFQSKGAQ